MAYRSETKKCLDSCKYEYSDTFCRLGEVFLAFSSGVLLLVAFGSSFWLVNKTDGVESHSGLWQTCTSECSNLPLTAPEASVELLAARTFMCIALGSGMMAWIISIVGLLQHRARWLLISAICYAVQAGLMVLGLGSYAKSFSEEDQDSTSSLEAGWSYSVGWVGCVLCLMCTLYFVSVALYRIKYPSVPQQRGESKSYAPLAQFESTETGSDDDDL